MRREARGARIAGVPLAPSVEGHRPGALRTGLVPGRSHALRGLDSPGASALGHVLARVHGRRSTTTGGLPSWGSRATSLPSYARRRGQDTLALARTAGERRLITGAAQAALAGARAAPAAPFAFLHGDLVEDNIVWPPGGGDPVLVDWEFWRMGDAAEDLAYLTTVNQGIPDEVTGHIYRGYGAGHALGARIDAWRALVLVDAALWHRAHGDDTTVAPLLERARRHLS